MINDANTIDLEDLDDVQDSVDNISYDTPEYDDYSSDSDSDSDSGSNSNSNSDLNSDEGFIDALLSLQGIYDKNKIKFEDESGAIVDKSWDTLSNNEKLMILSNQEDPDIRLDALEIGLINQIRESGLTPEQFIQNLQMAAVPVPEPSYEVDGMSDDELFCIDLLDKVGSDNISDEELQQALDNAKANPSLYSKQVASLRNYYKDLEQQRYQQIEIEKQQEAEHQYELFSNDILNAIESFTFSEDIPVELSHDDMEDLANFILTRDASGYSEFSKLLNNPDYFTRAAFWTLKGPDILNEMQNQIKEAYLRGYHDNHKPSNTRVVTRSVPTNRSNTKESQFAYFDEDSYLND